jgi:hypothetical protein
MEYIFTLGLVLLILGIWSLKNRIARIKNWNRATATVIQIREYLDSENDKAYNVVFKFNTQSKEEISFERTDSSSSKIWCMGDEASIVYDPQDPNKVVILTLINAFGIPLLLLTVALPLLFISVGYYWSQYFFNSLH